MTSGATLESLNPEDQSLCRMAKRVTRVPTPSSPLSPRRVQLSDSEKAEALADSVEAQFRPMSVTSVPAVIETFNVALRYYFLTPASEPKVTNPDEVHEAIRGLKVGKAPGPNTIPNIFPSERYPSSPRFSTPFSAPITFQQRVSMLEYSPFLNRG